MGCLLQVHVSSGSAQSTSWAIERALYSLSSSVQYIRMESADKYRRNIFNPLAAMR